MYPTKYEYALFKKWFKHLAFSYVVTKKIPHGKYINNFKNTQLENIKNKI